jgi:hypothetical protein
VVDHHRVPGGGQHALVERPQPLCRDGLEVVRRQHHHRPDGQVVEVRQQVQGVREIPLRDGRHDVQRPRLREEGVEHGALLVRGDRRSLAVGPERDDAGDPVLGEPPDVPEVGVDVDAEPLVVPERRHVGDVDTLQDARGVSRSHGHLPRSTVWSRNAVSSRRLGSPS